MARLQHRGGVLTPSVAGTVCSLASLMWEWVRKGGIWPPMEGTSLHQNATLKETTCGQHMAKHQISGYVFVFRRRHLYHHLGVCNFGNIGGAYFLLRHLLHLVCFASLFGWHPHFVLDSAGGLPPSKTIACRWYKPAGTPHQKRCEVQVGRLRKLNISSLQFAFHEFRTHDCIFVASTKTNSCILVIFDLHSVFRDAEKLEVPFWMF